MRVLIVESNAALAELWSMHLRRAGAEVVAAPTQYDAIQTLIRTEVDVIVLDLGLEDGSAMAVADFASYRRPDARVVFVTSRSFFSDGSIFNHFANAGAFLEAQTPPADLCAIVEHLGSR